MKFVDQHKSLNYHIQYLEYWYNYRELMVTVLGDEMESLTVTVVEAFENIFFVARNSIIKLKKSKIIKNILNIRFLFNLKLKINI